MNREKQIEEIRCENCIHHFACRLNGEYEPSPCRAYEDKAGYRKQSEGVWTLALATYGKCMCSNCKSEAPIKRADDGCLEYIKSKYCPNCGAKMKGGAEC